MSRREAGAALKERLWSRDYLMMLLANCFLAGSLHFTVPLISPYLVSLHDDIALAGVVSGALSAVALLVRPFTGYVTDAFDTRRLVLFSALGVTLSLLGYCLSENVALFAAFRVLHGFCYALCSTAMLALGNSFIPPGRMGEGMGYLGLSFALAVSLGPSAGLAFAGAFGYRAAFLTASVLGVLSIAVTAAVKPAPRQAEREEKRTLPKQLISTEILPLALLAGLFSFASGLTGNFLSLMCAERGIPHAGSYFLLLGALMLLTRPLSGKLFDRKGLAVILLPAFLLTALGQLALSEARGFPAVALAACLMVFGQGAGQPASQTMCIKTLGEARRGLAISTYYFFVDLNQTAAPLIGGLIAAAGGYVRGFRSGAGIMLAAFLASLLLQPGFRKAK